MISGNVVIAKNDKNRIYQSFKPYSKNPNPIPIGTGFGFLLFGASGVIGFMQKWRKIKGFRHSIIDNNLIYMHHCIYLILKKHSKKEKNLIKIGTRNDAIRLNEWCCFYIQN